jgi:hypothetical protein
MAEETMDVEKQIECLNRALRLQHRSVLHYSLVAGSVIGLEYQAHAEKMREHSLSELEDATRLVEKITALGGEPTTEVAPITFTGNPRGRTTAVKELGSFRQSCFGSRIGHLGRIVVGGHPLNAVVGRTRRYSPSSRAATASAADAYTRTYVTLPSRTRQIQPVEPVTVRLRERAETLPVTRIRSPAARYSRGVSRSSSQTDATSRKYWRMPSCPR